MSCIFGGIWQKKEKGIRVKIREFLGTKKRKLIVSEYYENFGYLSFGILNEEKTHSSCNSTASRFENEDYEIVFDGKILNSDQIKSELESIGAIFKKNSDSELVLNIWIFWQEFGFQKITGYFSFVIYDKKNKKIIFVRDAFGSKSFIYSFKKNKIVFGSDQETVLRLQNEELEANWQKSYDYLVHGNSGDPEQTFFQKIKNLNSVSLITINLNNWKIESKKKWWDIKIKENTNITYEEAVKKTREIFLENIKLFLKDKPSFGVTLSGGIDSSAIVGAIKYLYPKIKINSFSYIIPNDKLSEEKWVNKISNSLKIKSHKISADKDNLIKDLTDLIKARGEPFGSTSVYGQYQVFKLANKKKISVLLDGNGADLLLVGNFGYPGQRLLSLVESKQYRLMFKFARNWSKWPNRPYIRSWMHLGQIVIPKPIYIFLRHLMGRNCHPAWLNNSFLKDQKIVAEEKRFKISESGQKRRLMEYLKSCVEKKLPIESLCHTRGFSKRFQIESRTPFLTIGLAEFLYSLPEKYLISDEGETKHVFRNAMKGLVPDFILKRRSKGAFDTPEKKWLTASSKKLRSIIESSADIPIINQPELLKAFDMMVTGKIKFSRQMWRWINYIAWYNLIIKNKDICS